LPLGRSDDRIKNNEAPNAGRFAACKARPERAFQSERRAGMEIAASTARIARCLFTKSTLLIAAPLGGLR